MPASVVGKYLRNRAPLIAAILLIECLAIVWFKGPSSFSIPSPSPSPSLATSTSSILTRNKAINRNVPLALGLEDATTPLPYHRYTQSVLRNPARKQTKSTTIRTIHHKQAQVPQASNGMEQSKLSQKRSLLEASPLSLRRQGKTHRGGPRRLQKQEQEQKRQPSKIAAVDTPKRVKTEQVHRKGSQRGSKKSNMDEKHSEISKSQETVSATFASQNRQKKRPLTKQEKKSSQLIPVMDEEGEAIKDHFVSPRDIDGDGTPDSYVLLRPAMGKQKYMMDVGLFDETLIHT
ncbi:hypothetical protein EMPS_07896 [Entomortierella parvispora]|uniref:Uncharacterized protein n=1 Tax=Entomortierella parvispora TaxID=205924 RepID=A0A9P3HFD8_9FUNG|nr:hypothetical protein EMPS_07896 [Entomortierella parvispora]